MLDGHRAFQHDNLKPGQWRRFGWREMAIRRRHEFERKTAARRAHCTERRLHPQACELSTSGDQFHNRLAPRPAEDGPGCRGKLNVRTAGQPDYCRGRPHDLQDGVFGNLRDFATVNLHPPGNQSGACIRRIVKGPDRGRC